MKLDELKIHDILFFHTEDSFVPEAIQTITKSKWNHVGSISRIDSDSPDEIFVAESIASGYKERSIRESIEDDDKEILVCRYHADGVGGNELTASQLKMLCDWDRIHLEEDISYGFTQIAALAVLKQVNDDSVLGKLLAKKFENVQAQIEEFVPQMICSEAVFRKFNESACPIRILKDSKHYEHYTYGGGVLERYLTNHDTLDVVIEDWLSPHDLNQSDDIITLDTLEINWR
jgi:hypothetical protein